MNKYREQLVARIDMFTEIVMDKMLDSDRHRLDELKLQLKELDRIIEDEEMAVSEPEEFPEESPEEKRFYPASWAKDDMKSRKTEIAITLMSEKDYEELDYILEHIKNGAKSGNKGIVNGKISKPNVFRYLEDVLHYPVIINSDGYVTIYWHE